MKLISGVLDFDHVVAAIQKGQRLVISADESLLSKLPKGNWLGGTTPYFMAASGGTFSKDRAFVQELSPMATDLRFSWYSDATISSVYNDASENGFSFILIPAFAKIHLTFGLKAPEFGNFGVRPLVGWVAGTQLENLGVVAAKVYNGQTLESKSDEAIVLHATLPESHFADVNIVNIFETSNSQDELEFLTDGFEVERVKVSGKQRDFAGYIAEKKADIRWPLVGDYGGASVNLSFAGIDGGKVKLLAPVFAGVKYRLASPAGDYNAYLKAFQAKMSGFEKQEVGFSCNCVLNYKHGDLHGKIIPELHGPFVFGEIAYQLLNQTAVVMTICPR